MKLKTCKILIAFIIIFGLVSPFIQYFVIIEFFFLLIPLVVIFFTTLLLLLVSIFWKANSFKKMFFWFLIIPIFIFSQLLSTFSVSIIQKYRSEILIKEIENIKIKTGIFPKEYDTSLGIRYVKIRNKENFVIRFSRGFMITEKYFYKDDKWISYGWND